MTKLEKCAETYVKGKENKALGYAFNNCPSDAGMKDKYQCKRPDGSFEAHNCVKCWLEEIEDGKKQTELCE